MSAVLANAHPLLRAWPKAETRAVLQPFNVCVLGLSAGLLAFRGAYTSQTLWYALIALPTAVVCAQVGLWLFRRLPDAAFQRLLIALCFLSGLILMAREVF